MLQYLWLYVKIGHGIVRYIVCCGWCFAVVIREEPQPIWGRRGKVKCLTLPPPSWRACSGAYSLSLQSFKTLKFCQQPVKYDAVIQFHCLVSLPLMIYDRNISRYMSNNSVIWSYFQCYSTSSSGEGQQGGGITSAMQKMGLNQGMLAGIAASIFSAFMR